MCARVIVPCAVCCAAGAKCVVGGSGGLGGLRQGEGKVEQT